MLSTLHKTACRIRYTIVTLEFLPSSLPRRLEVLILEPRTGRTLLTARALLWLEAAHVHGHYHYYYLSFQAFAPSDGCPNTWQNNHKSSLASRLLLAEGCASILRELRLSPNKPLSATADLLSQRGCSAAAWSTSALGCRDFFLNAMISQYYQDSCYSAT